MRPVTFFAAEALSRLVGEAHEATLFGKGPSLDLFVEDGSDDAIMRRTGLPRPFVAVNESVLVVPRSIGIAYDPTPVTSIDWAVESDVPRENLHPVMITSDKFWSENRDVVMRFPVGSTYFRRCDYGGNVGTAITAITLLGEAGVKTLFMVGFDLFFHEDESVPLEAHIDAHGILPTAPYAKCLAPFVNRGTPAKREHDYRPINAAIREAAGRFGMDLVDGWPR